MGKKSSYFRHSFQAHTDIKLDELLEACGVKGFGVYFILLELYGISVSNEDESCQKQTIRVSRIAHISRLRSSSLRKILKKITELDLVIDFGDVTHDVQFHLSIPKFFKYYGKYRKTECVVDVNKSKVKQRKEKKSKTKEIKLPPPKKIDNYKLCAEFNFLDADLQEFISTTSDKMQRNWLDAYPHEYMETEILKAQIYYAESKKTIKSKSLFVNNWLKRSFDKFLENSEYGEKLREEEFTKLFGETTTTENPWLKN